MRSLAEFSQERLAPVEYPSLDDYRRVLLRWIETAYQDWDSWPLVPRTGTFGVLREGATTEAFAVRSTAEYAAACAAIWRDEPTWPLRDEILQQIIHSIRYVTTAYRLARYESISLLRLDLSVLFHHEHHLGVNFFPAALAARLVWDELGENDRAEVEHFVTSLASYFAASEVKATVEGHFTLPETNAWNAEFLLNACHMFPGHRDVARWREKAVCYLVNSLARASDRRNERLLDGKPIRDRFVGPNVHPNFGLEHHGIFHPNYMIHPIQRRGSIAYLCRAAGEEPPESTFYNAPEVFAVIKKLALWDGRIAHPSGQDLGWYARPEHFLIPACVFMEQAFRDLEARWLERLTFRIMDWEQEQNGTGYFHFDRLTQTAETSDISALSEEANAAYNLAVAYLMHKAAADRNTEYGIGNKDGTFAEPDAKVVFSHTQSAFASWSWRAYPGAACGLFIPRAGDHLAFWDNNMVSQYEVDGFDCRPLQSLVVCDRQETVENGFATLGKLRLGRAESGRGRARYALSQWLSYVALPDGETALLYTLVRAEEDITIARERHLSFKVANDVFNGLKRTVTSEAGTQLLDGFGEYRRQEFRSQWLNVDGMLGLISVDPGVVFTVETFPGRLDRRRSLAANLISCPYVADQASFGKGAVVRQSAFVFVGQKTDAQLAAYCHNNLKAVSLSTGQEALLATLLRAGDGRWYLVAANFGDASAEVGLGAGLESTTGETVGGSGSLKNGQLSLVGRSVVIVRLTE